MLVIFDQGENRHVRLKISSKKNENFEISSATYTLKKKDCEKVEASGDCIIIDHIMDSVICPKEKGEYVLKITYKIADEILIDDVKVVVM